MYRSEGRLITSATDLVGFLLCHHLTALDLQVAAGASTAPLTDDPQLAVVATRGLEHEAAHLQRLRDAGRTIVEIGTAETSLASLRAREAETLSALVAGADVVFQATFMDDRLPSHAWRGHSDFVTKVPGASRFGNYAYEPEDTKLARHVSPSAVLQLCQYAEQLERLQGSVPENIHVVLGDGERVSIRLADVASYYRAARSRFLDRALGSSPPTEALPTAHCDLCRWTQTCEDKWRADDALWLVAGLSREQARKFGEAGITSIAALASPDDGRVVRGIRPPTLTRLRRQARLQVAARAEPPGTAPPYELLSADEPGTGLSALPKPSPGDLFFDLEGDPFVGDGGIEYLLGIGWVTAGNFEFKAFWGHTPAEEKRAFQDLIDFVQERRSQDPDLHIYHYAPYERTALGRLMGRYATREEEVDELLRGNVLVDLYRVVKQALVLGSESYSLKKVERLYMPAREGEITNAASSIVEYERWLNNGDDAILREIERYNRVDCESTWMLREWLESRRPEAEAAFGIALSRPMPVEGQVGETVSEELDEVRALAVSLWPHDEPPGEDASDEARAPWLLAQLLDWHRREAKPEWWEYFHRVNVCTEEDLLADTEAIAGLSYDGVVGTEKRSSIHRYSFDPDQEHKLSPGKPVVDPAVERVRLGAGDATPPPGPIVALDPVNGTLDLKRGNSSPAVHPQALIPAGPVDTRVLREALRRLAVEAVKYGDGPGPNRAARDVVARRPPRLRGGVPGALLQQEGENALAAAVRCSLDLDDSYLPIQGPPGSGKTWTAARVIVELVRKGRRVGIAANSHAVISHLLEQVMAYGRDAEVPLRAVQKADLGQRCADKSVRCEGTSKKIEDALAAGEVDIVAGTAWLFAREGMAQSLDHLIIDEAGQLSLANVLAAGSAARNLVLIGDPRQLSQPSKGTHPPGVGTSGLEHLLAGNCTIAPDRGLFIDLTRRMNPAVCSFISEAFYDGRLHADASCDQQRIGAGGLVEGAGLRWLPVDHGGNRTSSVEEAHALDLVYRSLLGREWINQHGERRMLGRPDLLVVAPYNAQVSLLAAHLPEDALIGTVDMFQGREGAVVLVSMAASTAEDVPRGMEFLYSRNRLNVAVSRSRALVVLAASPSLLRVRCRSVEQMRLANGLCRYVEMATPVAIPGI